VTRLPGARSAYSPLVVLTLLAALCAVSGCASRKGKNDPNRASVETLYKNAHKAMLSSDYEFAIKSYEALTARFPFTDQARQARLDLIYVYYLKGQTEQATDAADEFLRENPTHPRVDYAWYMKGLINYEKQPNAIERWLGVDMTKRPPGELLKSISAFQTVVKQYPNSIYAHDAQRRMIYLRDRLAAYEINVARYYVRRGAYLAAAQRAQRLIEQYDGSPSVAEALHIMSHCYDELGLNELRDNVQRMYATNFPNGDPPGTATATTKKRGWWKLW